MMMSDFQISLIVDFVICEGGSKIKFSLKGLTALEAERRIFYLPFRFPEVVSLKSDVKSERVFLGDIYLLPIIVKISFLRGATALLRFPIF